MKSEQKNKKNNSTREPRIGRTVIDDFRRGDLKRSFKRDWRDLYDFYLDDKKRARLQEMGWFRRWLRLLFWLFKSLVLKLTPLRRVLLFVSIFLVIIRDSGNNANAQSGNNLAIFGFLLLLFVLAQELKDKLLAQDELAVGRKVQFALLPDDNPVLAGWDIWLYTRPANEVGGDLVDYLSISDTRLGLSLGDVAGKGLGAALLMAKLQATIRALAPTAEIFSEFGQQLNTIFCRDGLPNRFVSLFYLELQPNINEIKFLNAGHMPPYLVQKSGLTELPRGGPALGIHKKSTYNEQNIRLKPCDMMVVFSDGVTEARNEQGEFFGDRRLQNLLLKATGFSAERTAYFILNTVKNFIGDARPHDDLSLIIIRRQ